MEDDADFSDGGASVGDLEENSDGDMSGLDSDAFVWSER